MLLSVSERDRVPAADRSPAAPSASTTGSTTSLAPYWVRMDRAGNTFTAYQSADGTTWKLVGTDTIAMGANVLVGLGVSSHTTDAVIGDHVRTRRRQRRRGDAAAVQRQRRSGSMNADSVRAGNDDRVTVTALARPVQLDRVRRNGQLDLRWRAARSAPATVR